MIAVIAITITITTTICCMLTTSSAVDTIFENQPIVDGESILSKTGTFELGFFSPGSSKNRYVGIWYTSIMPRAVIWVANKHHPLNSTLGVFTFNREQMLLILNDTKGVTIIWSSKFSEPITDGIGFGQLLDTGNFVIKGGNKVDFIWQSLDFSENVFLPGIKFGKERYVTSWRSKDDPSLGEYSLRWEMNEYPQVYMMKGAIRKSRLGPWNGENFAGMPNYKAEEVGTYKMVFVNSQKEAYFSYSLRGNISIERGILTADGRLEFWHHNHDSQAQVWTQDWSIPLDNCDSYNMCGPYGSCNTLTSPYCGCLKGFERPEEWHPDNWTSGCQRKVALDCKPNEGFLQISGVKLPETKGSWFKEHITLEECAVACKNNCSCTAYANAYISLGKTGCLQWFGDLIDVRVYPQRGQDLYVRLAASELLHLQSGPKRPNHVLIDVLLSTLVELVILGIIFALYAWVMRKRSNVDLEGRLILDKDRYDTKEMGETNLPFFCFSKIIMATDNFSNNNKLGEGGFGAVYKGMLEGQEFAVKRLSKSSHQGLQEFKNEIKCVAKLQHRNLVKLLGYCIQGDDTMLIYEYMPNKSLDRFIFDDTKKPSLDWPQRFSIIHGIARGLLYLHQDSRFRVVHRDLKADNILLDAYMNPKISDFGLARMFGAHETEANTHKVVGTLGYISPEYAKDGVFSVKSDIFSFGVLVLEIISGKKNRGFSHQHHDDNLLGHAWRLYREGKALDFVDKFLGDSSWSVAEVTRSIMIGLLCVQHQAEDRPSMSSVLFMLGGEGTIPPPKRPGFFMEDDAPSKIPLQVSNNNLTITELCVR